MMSFEKGQRVIVQTLALYYDGHVDEFDGVFLKLTKPSVVFNVGNMNAIKSGTWTEAESMDAEFTQINIAHIVSITPVGLLQS